MMAMRRAISTLPAALRSSPTFSPAAAPLPGVLCQLLRPYPRLPRTRQPTQAAAALRRYAHSIPKPPANGGRAKSRKEAQPHYELTFTCVPCSERSTHTISKQGYHHGSVLITCPKCRNRHIISDHLDIFGDRQITVEDLMKERGQLVKRGTLGEDGDIEFWEDGTQTKRANRDTAEDDLALEDAVNAPSAQDTPPTPPAFSTETAASGPLTGGIPRPKLPTSSLTDEAPSSHRQYHSDATDSPPIPREPPNYKIRRLYVGDQNLNRLRAALRDMEEPEMPDSSLNEPLVQVGKPYFRDIQLGGLRSSRGGREEPKGPVPLGLPRTMTTAPRLMAKNLLTAGKPSFTDMGGRQHDSPQRLTDAGIQSRYKKNQSEAEKAYKKVETDVTQFGKRISAVHKTFSSKYPA